MLENLGIKGMHRRRAPFRQMSKLRPRGAGEKEAFAAGIHPPETETEQAEVQVRP